MLFISEEDCSASALGFLAIPISGTGFLVDVEDSLREAFVSPGLITGYGAVAVAARAADARVVTLGILISGFVVMQTNYYLGKVEVIGIYVHYSLVG